MKRFTLHHLFAILTMATLTAACAAPVAPAPAADTTVAEEHAAEEHAAEEHAAEEHADSFETPIADLQPAALDGRTLRVVATTNLVGEVAAIVGGDRIELKVLLPAGSDPHAYTATPQDMVALNEADLVLANGVGLEEALLPTLQELTGVPVISVNEGVTLLMGSHAGEDAHAGEEAHSDGEAHAGEEAHADEAHADEAHSDEAHSDEAHADEAHGEKDGHHHAGGDPHTWQNPLNVTTWATNVGAALGARDPANAAAYNEAAAAYAATLTALDAEVRASLAAIPAENRKLVTDHDTFAYFADAYDFTVIGSVIPSFSSLATISARDMAALQDQIADAGARAIFVGNTVSPALAEQVAQDSGVPVVSLFTDSLNTPGEEGDTYEGFMRANVAAIVQALQ